MGIVNFGLARETKSKPPYTEYVWTHWYRTPEVLLFICDYSNPIDMWALDTIMVEPITLNPLFSGYNQIDQVAQISEIFCNLALRITTWITTIPWVAAFGLEV